jgi:hypothetical protein
MLRLRILTLVGGVLALGALFAQAQQDDLKEVIRKSIAAHGGKEQLTKLKAVKSKFKGTMELLGMTIPITGETTFLMPNKLKNDMTIEINGMTIQIVQVYDGKTMWISQMGKTMEIKDEQTLKEMREGLLAEGAGSLVALLDGTYELSAAGEFKVKDMDAIGIRVSKKGQRDYTLYFDKKTNLVAKTEMRAFDTIGKQEVTQEKFLMDYVDRNGLKSPKHVVIEKDGKQFMDLDVTDSQMFEKLDDSNFVMP